MKRDFNEIIEGLKETIAQYGYYTDFKKVYENVEKFKIELHLLNSLIGEENIEEKFIKLINEYPKTLKVIPLLLAIRKEKNIVPILDEGKIINFDFNIKKQSDKEYIKFMQETGLFNLFCNKKIKCLIDYITGIEVGLDTNARKNRTGKLMESLVKKYISEVDNIEFYSEMKKSTIAEKYNIDINKLIIGENIKSAAEKRFDFVVKTNEHLYLFETNFYSGGGSKLNETARSFKSLALDIKGLENISFVWITDGVGWKSAKNNLKETYDVLDDLYTLTDLENGILKKILDNRAS